MSLSPEDIQAIARAMNPPAPATAQAPQGAITAGGIVKYQTIIIFIIMSIVGVSGWLVTSASKATTELVSMQRDIDALKRSQEVLTQVKSDQVKTSNDVRELQNAVSAITQGQKEIASDLRVVGQQVSAISQAMRGARP